MLLTHHDRVLTLLLPCRQQDGVSTAALNTVTRSVESEGSFDKLLCD